MARSSRLQGFQSVDRLLELANAVRALPDISREELAGILGRHGEHLTDLTASAFTDRDADELRNALTQLTAVLTEPDTDRAAYALNAILAEHGAPPRLSRHDGHPWHLHVDGGGDTGWGAWLLATSALALAQILTEYGRATWGACSASGCTRLFLGTGSGSAQRFCGTSCATRTRVAAHRRRHRPGNG